MITGKDDDPYFESLVQAHQHRLTALATRLLNGDSDSALDVVQETFLKLWRQRQREGADYVAPERHDLYLMRSVHNRCLDLLRRKSPRIGLDAHTEIQDISLGPEGITQARSLNEAVRMAISALPEAQRSVFVLSHYEGLRYHEIADMLDCPMGTIASRKNQAVMNLRRALKDWSDGERGRVTK